VEFVPQILMLTTLRQAIVAATEPISETIEGIRQVCPDKHIPIIDAILKLGGNDVQAKVSFDAVGSAVGKTKAQVQARGHGWVSYPHWAQKAQEEGWILQGGFGGTRWMALGSKVRELSCTTRILFAFY
jgi:hypothetical protein